jgi:hypothetical protein
MSFLLYLSFVHEAKIIVGFQYIILVIILLICEIIAILHQHEILLYALVNTYQNRITVTNACVMCVLASQ